MAPPRPPTADGEPGDPGGPAGPVTDGHDVVGVRFVGHSTVLLDVGGRRVLTDPFLGTSLGPLQRHGPQPDPTSLEDLDVIVISHGHRDHFDRPSLRAIPGAPMVVVPTGLGPAVRRVVRGEVVEIVAGDRIEVAGISVTAVEARHWISPGAARARPIGFLLEAGPSVWFAGDTGRFDALTQLTGRVDLALVPVWTWGPHLGPGHLGPRSAAEVVAEMAVSAVVPIHWGTLYPRRLHRVWSSPLDEPGPRFARHVAGLPGRIDVRVLRPGASTSIDVPQRRAASVSRLRHAGADSPGSPNRSRRDR
jgi:L-ascorbate metabolism protein UlaG (beta-lactamase superfamily)